jgi:hypothetical protein
MFVAQLAKGLVVESVRPPETDDGRNGRDRRAGRAWAKGLAHTGPVSAQDADTLDQFGR